jgi:hypothetical protein
MAETRFAWLIEAPGPCYMATDGTDFYWVKDANRAAAFGDKTSAELLLSTVTRMVPEVFRWPGPTAPKPVEHGWHSGEPTKDGV